MLQPCGKVACLDEEQLDASIDDDPGGLPKGDRAVAVGVFSGVSVHFVADQAPETVQRLAACDRVRDAKPHLQLQQFNPPEGPFNKIFQQGACGLSVTEADIMISS